MRRRKKDLRTCPACGARGRHRAKPFSVLAHWLLVKIERVPENYYGQIALLDRRCDGCGALVP